MPATTRFDAMQLPDGNQARMDFLESSFYKGHDSGRCLPSPVEVRASSGRNRPTPQPPPVKFEHLDLIVKYGPHVTVAEAQCLWMIKRVLREQVPVPEVYGWRVDGQDVFIYMEFLRGETLKDRWDFLSVGDRTTLCNHLHQIMESLRHVEQDPKDPFIGMICKQVLLEDRHRLNSSRLHQSPPSVRHCVRRAAPRWSFRYYQRIQ